MLLCTDTIPKTMRCSAVVWCHCGRQQVSHSRDARSLYNTMITCVIVHLSQCRCHACHSRYSRLISPSGIFAHWFADKMSVTTSEYSFADRTQCRHKICFRVCIVSSPTNTQTNNEMILLEDINNDNKCAHMCVQTGNGPSDIAPKIICAHQFGIGHESIPPLPNPTEPPTVHPHNTKTPHPTENSHIMPHFSCVSADTGRQYLLRNYNIVRRIAST